jgi:hypothetical protein
MTKKSLKQAAKDFIKAMEWSDTATDYLKEVVVGNIWGFEALLEVRLKEENIKKRIK